MELKEIVEKKISNTVSSVNSLTFEECKRLRELKFYDVSTINNFFEREKYKEKIAEYKILYPQHPFITRFEINEILIENPELAFEHSKYYKYSIPESNIREILNFKVHKNHINNHNIYHSPIKDFDYKTVCHYYVLAPKIMFKREGVFSPDPLVFFEVWGGFLLVTGWGAEVKLVSNPGIN